MKTYALLKINPDLHHALKMKAAAEKTTLIDLTQRAIENLLKNDAHDTKTARPYRDTTRLDNVV